MRLILATTLMSFGLLAISFVRLTHPIANNPPDAVNISRLDFAVQAAGEYLIRATDSDGRLLYKAHVDSTVPCKTKYNVLRHAGTMYSLADYHRHHGTEQSLAALHRQARFLVDQCAAPLDTDQERWAIWSDPELTSQSAPRFAKLGGTGLGLVALLSVDAVQPGTVDLSMLQRLGNFLLFMQRDDGSFYSRYGDHLGGRSDEWTSLYFPGEAALGLVMLYERDGDTRWLQAAAKALAYLADRRRGRDSVEADHWALLATDRLISHQRLIDSIASEDLLVSHAEQICRSVLGERIPHAPCSPLYGCFSGAGRTCPTATRLEGLQAALPHVRDAKLARKIEQRVVSGINFLLATQIKAGDLQGGIPRSIRLGRSRSRSKRAGEVRVDYVQHALSAMIKFEQQPK